MLTSVSVLARVSVALADTMVIGVTWMTLRHQVKESHDLNMGSRVSAIMLADGRSSSTAVGVANADFGFDRKRVLHVRTALVASSVHDQ